MNTETIKTKHFYKHLRKQILIMLGLSLGPGLGYVVLGIIHDAIIRSLAWYLVLAIVSIWGYKLYKSFIFETMSKNALATWYRDTTYFYYCIFSLWTVIFILYVPLEESKMHYIAIFTQIGASVVASSLLFSDRRLFIPIIFILTVPLIIYFSQIGSWYGYVLTIFSCVFTGVLYYASTSSYSLLEKTNFQAAHDQLTGLFNRNYFVDAMQQVINTLRSDKSYSCLILIDLDHFKTINDSLGHDIGDIMLKEVAHRMNKIVPEDAVIARMGGDEFIVVGSITSTEESCFARSMKMAEELRESLKTVYIINQHQLYISASIGISLLHTPDENAGQYIKEADIAMYEVKDKGRDGIVVFGKEIAERVEKNLQIERLLHSALENDEFFLNFQPQFNTAHEIVGCEVLLRWNNKELGFISPADFIPIAEKTGLIIDIGTYVLEESFKALRDWEKSAIDLKKLSINVSMRQFFDQNFLTDIEKLTEKYLSSELTKKIVLELTESIMADEINKLIDIMNLLKAKGFSFSIDDFGTGYSSLSYLRQVPVDEIKIDRSFINELTTSKSDRSMIEIILNLSKAFKLKVVAEGVETKEQEEILLQHKCVLFQGFLFSRPLLREDFEELLRNQSLD